MQLNASGAEKISALALRPDNKSEDWLASSSTDRAKFEYNLYIVAI